MARSTIEPVAPDLDLARRFIEQGRALSADAELAGISAGGSFFLSYQACVAGIEAILAAAGRRVTSGEASHHVMLAEAAAIVGSGYQELFDSLNAGRGDRNMASYVDPDVSFQTVQATRLDSRELLQVAEDYVTSMQR